MRATSRNWMHNKIHCPFCRSQAEELSGLIICSDCKASYHQECWVQNRGCSVFGCTGHIQNWNGINVKSYGEPKWLIALRIVVFGFIPFVMMFVGPAIKSSVLMSFIAFWFFAFLVGVPALIISEIICLILDHQHPELRPKFGDRAWHIISLSLCGIGLLMFFGLILIGL